MYSWLCGKADNVVTGQRIAALCEFNCNILYLVEDNAASAVGFRLYEREYGRLAVSDVHLLILVLETWDYLGEKNASVADRSIEIVERLAVMALEVVLKECFILGFAEVYAVALEFAFKLSLALDDILVAALLFEPRTYL